MSCSSCTPTNPIGQCPTTLTIGTVPYLSTDMYVYIKNLATGHITILEATSSIAGVLTADLTDVELPANQDLELWTSRQTDGLNVQSTITIGADGASCLIVRFERPKDENGDPITYGTQTLSIEA